MDVVNILENIKNQALIGNTGLPADTDKLVNYLNIAYRGVYDEIARSYPFFVATTQSVVITDGQGTLSPAPAYVLSVRDTGNTNQLLYKKDVEAIQADDNRLDAVGAPSNWYQEGFSTIKTYPVNSTTLSVRYVPNPATLSSTSLEAEIMIPPLYHDVLVWETLRTVMFDERDKLLGPENVIIDKRCEEIWGRLNSYLAYHTAQEPIRTKGVCV